MSTLLADPIWSAALGLALKASAVLALAVLAEVLLRRRGSAATRHLVWALALAALVMLPIASVVVPEWRMAVATMSPAASVAAASADIDPLAVAGQSETPSSVGTATSQGSEPPASSSPRGHHMAWSALAASVYLVGVARGSRAARHPAVEPAAVHPNRRGASRSRVDTPARRLRRPDGRLAPGPAAVERATKRPDDVRYRLRRRSWSPPRAASGQANAGAPCCSTNWPMWRDSTA